MKRIAFIFIAFLCCVSSSYSQSDTSFWFVAPEVWIGHDDRPIYLRFASFDEPATITISQPANALFPNQTVTLSANDAASIDLTAWIDIIENKPYNEVLNYGIYISSTSLVTAYYEEGSTNNPDIFSLKGQNALGLEFYTPFQTFLNNNYTQSKAGIDIVATEDNTEIQITPTQDLEGYLANTTFTITLNMGETYSLRASSVFGSLHPSGTHILSNKPIAVSVSDDSVLGNPYYGPTAFDLMADQLIPVEQMGLEYIVIKGELNEEDKIYITASEDNTDILVNGAVVANINTSETYQMDLFDPCIYFTSTKPVVALHMTGYGSEVCGAILPPINCTGSQNVSFIRSVNNPFFKLNILVKSGGEDDFLFNGASGIILDTDFEDVPNTSGEWKFASITEPSFVNVLTNSNISNDSSFFHVGIIMGRNSSSRYGYFSNFNKFEHKITTSTETYCEGDVLVLNGEFINNTDYNWNGPSGFTASGNNFTFGVLSLSDSGTYVLSGQIGECDVVSDSINVIINALDDASFSISDFCIDTENTATINGTTGGNFSLLNSSDGATINPLNANISNATVGTTYDVQYSTSGNCPSISVESTTALAFEDPSFITTDFCYGDNNSVIISGTSGGQFSFSSNPNGAEIDVITGALSNVTEGSLYSIEYTTPGSLTSCSTSSQEDVEVFTIPASPIVSPSEYCDGESILPIIITPSESGSMISWYSDSSLTDFIQSSNAYAIPYFLGTTTVYLNETSINNCVSDFSSAVQTIHPLPNINAGEDQTICFGESITLSGSGGMNYSWDNGVQNNLAFTPSVGLNTYILFGESTDNCFNSDTVNINVNPNPTPFAGNDQDVCGKQTELVATDNGISAVWSNASAVFADTNTPQTTVSVADYGLYTFSWTETNAFGCTFTDAVSINFLETPEITLSTNFIQICENEEVLLNGSSNNSANPEWTTNGSGDFLTTANAIIYDYSQADIELGEVQVYFTTTLDDCTDTDTVIISIKELPVTNLYTDNFLCENDTTMEIYVSNDGNAPFKYELTVDNEILLNYTSFNSIDTFIISEVGHYKVVNYADNYCLGNSSDEINVYVRENPLASFTVYPRETSILSPQIQMNNFTSNVSYCQWWFGDSTYSDTDCNPSHLYNDIGTFDILMLVENEFGCMDSMRNEVIINPEFELFIPTAFTPDYDDVNDVFLCKGFGISEFFIRIFSRWGELIYTSNDINESWNGKTQKGTECMNGVYSYRVEVIDLIGKKHFFDGEIHLLR
ncbi:MAG: gliding motility-associated C-terminal domain-containing protein [Flavobacteriales bacterium]|nr:gliding motility-associated C-terminal domain-containing protein [Flavobacteriales bacterium]